MTSKETSLGRKANKSLRPPIEAVSHYHSVLTYELYPFDDGGKYLVDGYGFYVTGPQQTPAPHIDYSLLASAAAAPKGAELELLQKPHTDVDKALNKRAERLLSKKHASKDGNGGSEMLVSSTSSAAQPSSFSVHVPPTYKHFIHLMEEHHAIVMKMDEVREQSASQRKRYMDVIVEWQTVVTSNSAFSPKSVKSESKEDVRDSASNPSQPLESKEGVDPKLNAESVAVDTHSQMVQEEPKEAMNSALTSSEAQRLSQEAQELAESINNASTLLRQYRSLKAHNLRELRVKIRQFGGIPCPTLRRHVWNFFSGSPYADPTRREGCSSIYARLVNTPIDTEHSEVILRDLGRTFPTHSLFQDSAAAGQTALRRILHAYCAFDPELGYCQGMGFIVAVLLLQAPEEEAFWLLTQLLHGRSYAMRELYISGFPLLQKFFVIFRGLFRKLLPHLSAHFDQQGVDIHFYGSQWFLTLFAYQFPIAAVCRIWDFFLSEGWPFIFKVAIAMLDWHQMQLLQLKMENILPLLKSIHEEKGIDELLRRALDVPITSKDLNECLTLEDETH